MAISTRERNILVLASIVALVFIATSIAPGISSMYAQRQENIETLRLDISREQRLIQEAELWRARREDVELTESQLEKQIFVGDTIPVVEASIQRELSGRARDAGINVNATRLAERLETEDWLLISQEMSFTTTDASNTVKFLEQLKETEPRLRVVDFSLNRSRNRYNGSITVVGFARSASLGTQLSSSR
ncbi:MAG: hypothetical protein AB8B95_03975 [Pseudohongiellaceae bacterium]